MANAIKNFLNPSLLDDLVLPKNMPKNNMRMMEPGSDENTFEALFRFRGGTAEAKEEFTFLRAMM